MSDSLSQPLHVIHDDSYKSLDERDDNFMTALASDDEVSSGTSVLLGHA